MTLLVYMLTHNTVNLHRQLSVSSIAIIAARELVIRIIDWPFIKLMQKHFRLLLASLETYELACPTKLDFAGLFRALCDRQAAPPTA